MTKQNNNFISMGIKNLFFRNEETETTTEKKDMPTKKRLKKRLKVDSIYDLDIMDQIDNPDKVLKLQGLDVTAYDNLMHDTEIFSAFDVRDSGVLSRKWEIEQDDSDNKVYELISNFFEKKFKYRNNVKAILKGRNYGYQPLNLVWDYWNEFLFPLNIHIIHRKHFTFNKDNQLLFNSNGIDSELVDEHRILLSTYEATYENPYGEAILSKCLWPITFKKSSKKFWAVFIEKYGMPWVTAFLEQADTDDQDAFREILDSMVQDGIIVTNKGNDIQVNQTGSTQNAQIYNEFIAVNNAEIAKAILGHGSATSSTPGKLGNENMAQSAAQNVIDADCELVVEQINTLIKYICEINWGENIELPKFKFVEEESLNKQKAERDVIISELRAGGQFTDEYIKRTYNLEDGDLAELKQEAAALDSEDEANNLKDAKGFMIDYRNKSFTVLNSNPEEENTKDQKIADSFIDKLAADEDNNDLFFGAMVNDIISETKNYDSLEDLKDNYQKFYKKIKTGKLEDRLVSAQVIMNMFGQHSVDIENNEIEKEGADNLSIQEFYNKVPDNFIPLQELLLLLDKDPDDILEWFRSKEVIISEDMETTIKAIKNHSFTVTGVTKLDMLNDFKKEIEKAIRDGLSYASFKKNIYDIFEKKGYLVSRNGNKLTPGYRLETIYRTNMQSSYMQGRWDRELATIDLYPYVQCVSVIDPSTTKECKGLNLKVFKKDDVYYQKYLRAPGHFNCRRRSRSLDDSKLERRNLEVSKGLSNKQHKNAKGFEKDGKPWQPNLSKYPKELREMYGDN